jgi:hypothetical protein
MLDRDSTTRNSSPTTPSKDIQLRDTRSVDHDH